jgi:hypothetical protein
LCDLFRISQGGEQVQAAWPLLVGGFMCTEHSEVAYMYHLFPDDTWFFRLIKGGAIIGFLLGILIGFAVGGIGGSILFAIVGSIGGVVAVLALWGLGLFLFDSLSLGALILLAAAIILGGAVGVIYLLWGVGKPH